MIFKGILRKNTLKFPTLEADFSILYFSKEKFQMDRTVHGNI